MGTANCVTADNKDPAMAIRQQQLQHTTGAVSNSHKTLAKRTLMLQFLATGLKLRAPSEGRNSQWLQSGPSGGAGAGHCPPLGLFLTSKTEAEPLLLTYPV